MLISDRKSMKQQSSNPRARIIVTKMPIQADQAGPLKVLSFGSRCSALLFSSKEKALLFV